jgi:hypothetical protein
MVSKCANSGCPSVFLYLHAGRVFRIEVEPPNPCSSGLGKDQKTKKPARRAEYFWLCEDCAAKMTLVFQQDGGIKIRPIAQAKAAASSQH